MKMTGASGEQFEPDEDGFGLDDPSAELTAALLDVILGLDEVASGGTFEQLVSEAVAGEAPFLSEEQRTLVEARLIADAVGYGPLERLLADPAVEEVMVNGPSEVWVERAGRLELTEISFGSAQELREAADRLLATAGRRVDDLSPLADARLPDGARVNVALPPLAVDGPVVTIRRFNPDGFSLADLVDHGTIDQKLAGLLAAAVRDGLNLIVSGATGSGKTTTLAALAREIPQDQRVVTIEDAAELRLEHPHVVRLEARPPAPGGGGAVSIRDLLRNSLRMRPDRIVVGEVRGGEAIDMLDAMATGHSGSLSTIHAGSSQGALMRLAGLAHQAGLGIVGKSIDERICAAVDLVTHQRRMPDGRRVVDSAALVSSQDGHPTAVEFFQMKDGKAVWRAVGEHGKLAPIRFP